MKKLLLITFIGIGMLTGLTASAQQEEDKSKRPSPPAVVKETVNGNLTVTIDYSQPALKGRAIGKELAPYGKPWRTGANETTTFEISKDAKVAGKALPAGKYSLYSIPNEKEWVFILDKNLENKGEKPKEEAKEVLRFTVKPVKAPSTMERMTFKIDKKGIVSLLWGDVQLNFTVK
jgi:hypothetical protein